MAKTTTKKACSQCKAVKPLSAFHRNKSHSTGTVSKCKRCTSAISKLRGYGRGTDAYKKNKQRRTTPEQKAKLHAAKVAFRLSPLGILAGVRHHLRNVYGLSITQYEQMYFNQSGLCSICDNPLIGNLMVDHDHLTGKVRGLLCGRCNSGLGHFCDDIDSMCRAQAYLRQHRK